MGLFDIFSGPNVEQMKKDKDLDNLVLVALDHRNDKIRSDAAKAIREIKTKFFNPPYIKGVGNDTQLGERLIHSKLLTMALIDNPVVRRESAITFFQLGGTKSIDAFKKIFIEGGNVYRELELPFFEKDGKIMSPLGEYNDYDVRKNAFEDLIIIDIDVKKIIDSMREHNQIRPIHEKIIKELLP